MSRPDVGVFRMVCRCRSDRRGRRLRGRRADSRLAPREVQQPPSVRAGRTARSASPPSRCREQGSPSGRRPRPPAEGSCLHEGQESSDAALSRRRRRRASDLKLTLRSLRWRLRMSSRRRGAPGGASASAPPRRISASVASVKRRTRTRTGRTGLEPASSPTSAGAALAFVAGVSATPWPTKTARSRVLRRRQELEAPFSNRTEASRSSVRLSTATAGPPASRAEGVYVGSAARARIARQEPETTLRPGAAAGPLPTFR